MGDISADGESAGWPSDLQLLSRARSDASAFGVFYDRFERACWRSSCARPVARSWRRTSRRRCSPRHWPQLTASGRSWAARAWLFGIARHELADAWRRGQVEDRARKRLGLAPLVLADAELERIEARQQRGCARAAGGATRAARGGQ